VCRSWGGAQLGSQPQPASGNIPHRRHRAQFRNGGWLGGKNFFHEFDFSVSSSGSPSSASSAKPASSVTAAQGPAAQSVVGWWEKFYCVSLVLRILLLPFLPFVVLFNCLYLSPRVLLFSHSAPHPSAGAAGGASERLPGPTCRLQGYTKTLAEGIRRAANADKQKEKEYNPTPVRWKPTALKAEEWSL